MNMNERRQRQYLMVQNHFKMAGDGGGGGTRWINCIVFRFQTGRRIIDGVLANENGGEAKER